MRLRIEIVKSAVALLCVNSLAWAAMRHDSNVPLYAIWEHSVTNDKSYSNPFDYSEIELRGTFTSPSGEQTEFFGYYDGNGSGGQSGNTWEIRFMPTETGTWDYELSFSDGTPVDNGSGSFTVVSSELPGPVQLYSGHTWFLADASDTPIPWKGYDIHSVHRPYNTGKDEYWEGEGFVKDVIDEHLLGQGYNATQIGGPAQAELFENGSDLTRFHLKNLDAFDRILDKLAENHVYTVNWNAIVWQNHNNGWDNLHNHYRLVYRYYVARYAPYYNYFGWSPTWETMELTDDKGRSETYAKAINEYSPWEKFPTAHDAARSEWSDWQRVQLRQHQCRTVGGGNTRTDVRDTWSGYEYVVFGSEDLWEASSGQWGQPRNGTEVRHALWGELLAGVYTLYYEWHHGGTGFAPSGGVGNGEGDTYNKIALDIWYDHTRWYTYTMKNDLVEDGSNCRCSGKDNAEYFVYDQNGGGNAIDLSGASGTYELTWFNPLTGDSERGGTVDGGSSVSLDPPGSMSSEWAVLVKNQEAVDLDTRGHGPKRGGFTPSISCCGNDVRIGFSAGKAPVCATVYRPNGVVVFRTRLDAAGGEARLRLPEHVSGMHLLRIGANGGDHTVKLNVVP